MLKIAVALIVTLSSGCLLQGQGSDPILTAESNSLFGISSESKLADLQRDLIYGVLNRENLHYIIPPEPDSRLMSYMVRTQGSQDHVCSVMGVYVDLVSPPYDLRDELFNDYFPQNVEVDVVAGNETETFYYKSNNGDLYSLYLITSSDYQHYDLWLSVFFRSKYNDCEPREAEVTVEF